MDQFGADGQDFGFHRWVVRFCCGRAGAIQLILGVLEPGYDTSETGTQGRLPSSARGMLFLCPKAGNAKPPALGDCCTTWDEKRRGEPRAMRYLLTGGAGFIGSHLAERLIADGHSVLVLDDLSTGRFENIAHLDDRSDFVLRVASVTDESEVDRCVAECQAVFHLASAVGVRLVVEQPVRTIETIVNGTDVVLRACARYRRPILITSTSEVYGKGTRVPFTETDDCLIGPTTTRRWAYACAKALDEFLALAHWHEARLPVVIARLFNTVGPRQTGRYGMVIPRFVAQALAGEPITVYGEGSQSRCFAHVADVVDALVKLFQSPGARGQVFNIGNNEEITIGELAERVKQATGSTCVIRRIPYNEAYTVGFEDMMRRVPDLTRIREQIGYRPRRGLDEILADVISEQRAGAADQAELSG